MYKAPIYILLFTLSIMFEMLLTGCKTQHVTGSQSTESKTDSTRIVERLRIDTVTIPGDTISIIVPLECDSFLKVKPVSFTQKSKRSGLSATVINGRLNAIFNCDEYKAEVLSRDSLIDRLQKSAKTQSTTVVEVQKYIPKVFWWAMVFSCCVLTYWLSKAAWWLYKKYQTGGIL